MLLNKAEETVEKLYQEADEKVKFILKVEATQIFTLNHYYAMTCNNIKANNDIYKQMHPEINDIEFSSNEDQEILNIQIKIFAYWKTMIKRMIDYICMFTRTILNSEISEKTFCKNFIETFHNAKKSKIDLMSKDDEILNKIKDLKNRIDKLTKIEKAGDNINKKSLLDDIIV